MLPIVSIITAVYNAEKYIERCLDSLVNQTLKDIEIILVNDGSTDKSLEILNKYAKKDSRIIVLSQENSKQGAARNRGIEIARGEFITYVDADDWLERDYCELLYNAAKKYNVNIAAAVTTRDYKHRTKYHIQFKDEKTYYGTNSIVKALEYNFITHSKLYRLEPIKNLRFEENVFYEDGPYTIKALDAEKSLVTVPNARYHYYSNRTSTIKQKLDAKRENDKISTSLQQIRYAKEHNIELKNNLIYKDNHFCWNIKHYYEKKELYLCGIKILTKKLPFNNMKNFVVFNTACMGDVLLCNSLVQNIKNIFPESRVFFVCDKNWKDIAMYQKGVDDVVIYDKKGKNKGFGGLLKFVREFPAKNIYASFITYKNEKNYLAAKLLKSRFVFMQKQKNETISVQKRHSKLLEPLTNKKIINYPITYNLPNLTINSQENIINNGKYITLCCTAKNDIKNMPLEIAAGLIDMINEKTNSRVVFLGAGKKAYQYSKDLEELSCNFVNLVNKTSLLELGNILQESEVLISVDTGTMHLGYSLGVKTLCLFFEKGTTTLWAPESTIYKNTLVRNENITVNNIWNDYLKLKGINE